MKAQYVEGCKYIPIWDTNITFNSTPNGYYEKFVIGLAVDGTEYSCVTIIQSCGNGCGDNRLLVEDDNTVSGDAYVSLINWIGKKITDLHNNQAMFLSMAIELGALLDWLDDELNKKDDY